MGCYKLAKCLADKLLCGPHKHNMDILYYSRKQTTDNLSNLSLYQLGLHQETDGSNFNYINSWRD